jgi:programmed cell death 6-interacting protein
LKEATRLAHGGTGDVKTEWFEDIFGKGLEKYERLKEEMMEEVRKQDGLLEQIRVSSRYELRAKRVASGKWSGQSRVRVASQSSE